jgi:hypothetical protein
VRRDHLAAATAPSKVRTPVAFPDVEFAFAAYPTHIVEMDTAVIAAEHARSGLASLLKLPLTSYLASSRVADEAMLLRLLERAATACQLTELEALLAAAGAEPKRCRATLAWMLKYDLLRMK